MLTLLVVAVAFVAFAAFVVVAYRKHWEWTGLPAASAASTGAETRPMKTGWDWLQLLVIPLMLAWLAFFLTNAQSDRDQRREDQRADRQQRIAADAERENTLRTYLAQMSDLMLDRRLLRSKPGAEVRNVARTATLTAIRRLDGARRGLVVQFLAEARLLRREKDAGAKVDVASADLTDADLTDADLGEADLRRADLGEAILSDADLRRADLRGTILGAAILEGTDLRRANLIEADLMYATLTKVDFRLTELRGADFTGADVTGADFRGARDADLAGARGKPAHGP